MFRSHRNLLAASLAAAFSLSSSLALAQGQDNQGGRRNQGGQGGPGGNNGGPGGFGGGPGGFGGGPGGRGGPGSNPLSTIPMLLGVEAVQVELKLTDEQKTQIKAINDKANQKRTAMFEKMRNNNRGNRGNNQGGNNQGGNNNNNGGNNNGGNNADRTAVFEEMSTLQKETEKELAGKLKPEQSRRVTEIALQVAGPRLFISDFMIGKLNLDDGQVEQIREILDEMRDAQFAMFRQMRGNNGGPGGNNGGPGGNNGGPGGNNGGPGGNNGGRGGNNRRGGNNDTATTKTETAATKPGAAATTKNEDGEDDNGGRGNRPDPNSPEAIARRAQMQTERAKMNEKAMVAIAKKLTANQRKVTTKLLGAKFDTSTIEANRPGGPGRNNTQAAATPAATPAPAPTAAPATAAATKPTGRVPLSQRRGTTAAPATPK